MEKTEKKSRAENCRKLAVANQTVNNEFSEDQLFNNGSKDNDEDKVCKGLLVVAFPFNPIEVLQECPKIAKLSK